MKTKIQLGTIPLIALFSLAACLFPMPRYEQTIKPEGSFREIGISKISWDADMPFKMIETDAKSPIALREDFFDYLYHSVEYGKVTDTVLGDSLNCPLKRCLSPF